VKLFLKFATQAKLPSFYLTVKVHKSPPAGRPIVAANSWYTTGVSKYLGVKMQEIVSRHPGTILADSFSLVKTLEATPIPPQATLVTFDVENLYPSIPHALAITKVHEYLRRNADPHTAHFLTRCLRYVLHHNYFEFQDVCYHQTMGIAMGTNAAVHIANVTLLELETHFLAQRRAKNQPSPALYKRYIDDGFFIWTDSTEALYQFQNDWSTFFHPTFKFTWNTSQDTVNFLDLHISKGTRFQATGLLDIATHQKELNKYLYLPFSSGHNLQIKRAFIRAELMRYVRNSSSLDNYIQLARKFFQRLRARGYPPSLLRPVFAQVRWEQRSDLLQQRSRQVAKIGQGETPIFLVTRYTQRANALRMGALLTQTRARTHTTFLPRAMVSFKRTANLKNLLTRAHCPEST
jgi:hypothetical protein